MNSDKRVLALDQSQSAILSQSLCECRVHPNLFLSLSFIGPSLPSLVPFYIPICVPTSTLCDRIEGTLIKIKQPILNLFTKLIYIPKP